MLTINHNLTAHIARLQALKDGVPAAIQRALDTAYWTPLAIKYALAALRQEAKGREGNLIPFFMDTIAVQLLDQGHLQFRMHGRDLGLRMRSAGGPEGELPFGDGTDGTDGTDGRGLDEPKWGSQTIRRNEPAGGKRRTASLNTFFRGVFLDNKEVARQMIRDWVESGEKQITEVDRQADGAVDMPAVARGIYEIIFNETRSSERQEATRALLRTQDESTKHYSGLRLIDYFIMRTASKDPKAMAAREGFTEAELRELAGKWLLAVLAAWREMVLWRLPLRIRGELRGLRK